MQDVGCLASRTSQPVLYESPGVRRSASVAMSLSGSFVKVEGPSARGKECRHKAQRECFSRVVVFGVA